MTEISLSSSKFMNWFWDLASDDSSRRFYSGTMIIKHIEVQNSKLNLKDENKEEEEEEEKKNKKNIKLCSDGEYTLKRLIRGISSSRDSARQGFSSCLCQFLKNFNVNINEVIELIDDSTKQTGNLKGSEERELMFGRLFNYLAIIRAGKVNDSKIALHILDRFIELHKRKGWIREVVSEAILSLLNTFPNDEETVQSAINKIKLILEINEIDEIPAHDLILISGLQAYSEQKHSQGFSNLSQIVNQFIPIEPIFSVENFPLLEKTFVAACYGFPKIHRVWSSLFFTIFGSEERTLPSHRLTDLNSKQLSLLTTFMEFLVTHLLPIGGTHERKSVAYYLILDIMKVVPIQYISVVLTSHIVRSLSTIRSNQKNTLFDLAGYVLKELVNISSYPCHNQNDISYVKLTIANILTSTGGMNYDNKTQTNTIASLLSELNIEMIIQYIESLCDLISSSLKKSYENKKHNKQQQQQDDDDDNNDNDDENTTCPSLCIASLYSIIKNPRLVERGTITAIILGIFLRLGCYGTGITPELIISNHQIEDNKKKNKKSSKKNQVINNDNDNNKSIIFTENGISIDLAKQIINLIRRVETNITTTVTFEQEGNESPNGLIALVTAARSRLLTILSDTTYSTLDTLNKSNELIDKSKESSSSQQQQHDEQQDKEKNIIQTGPTFLQIANSFLNYFEASGLSTIRQIEFNDDDEDEDNNNDNDNEEEKNEKVLKSHSIKELLSSIKNTIKEFKSNKQTDTPQKLVNSFEILLTHTTYHILCSEEVDIDSLQSLVNVLPKILSEYYKKKQQQGEGEEKSIKKNKNINNDNDSEEEDDDDEDNPQAELLDCCIDLLAVSSAHSIKGIRDAIKRVWVNIIHFCGLHQDGMEAVLMAVIGNDTINDDNEDDENNDDNDGNDDQEDNEDGENDNEDDEEEESEDDENDESNENKNNKNKKQKVQVTEEDVLKMLENEDLDLDEDAFGENGELLHTESADAALAHMIQVRQQHRKQGLLQAKRQELITRSRAIDILEIFLHRNDNPMIIIPLFRPLLYCLKKVTTSSLCQNIQEGRIFQQRLKSVIETKLSKLKFSIPTTNSDNENDIELNNFITNTVSSIIDYCNKLFNSSDLMLRHVSYQCYLCIVRSIIHSNNIQLKTYFNTHYNNILINYFNHKNHKLNNKIINDIITRYTDYIVTIIFETIINGMITSKTEYLQNESFRLLTFIIISQFSSLTYNNRTYILNFIPKILQNVKEILSNNNNLTKYKVKRIKGLLTFMKSISQFIKNYIKLNKNETNYNLVYNGKENKNDTESKTITINIDKQIILGLKTYFSNSFSDNFSFIVNNISIKRIYEQITNILNEIPSIKTNNNNNTNNKNSNKNNNDNSNQSSTATTVKTTTINGTSIENNKSSNNESQESKKNNKKRNQESNDNNTKEKKNKKKRHEERDFEMELVTDILNEKKKQQSLTEEI